jgi:hypothetical protein
MTMQAKQFDEWLDRAFRLAFFLHGDRETAKRIVTGAMNKLETASNAQFKRYYYVPVGRAENARAARSRVSLSDLQLLQRLVFVESETFERAKEISENVSERSLVKFFVKHLVRIALKRNSFYVTLAVARILHNYPTAAAMDIYNIVIQDPERVHDDYYYRSRKAVLMKELKARFDDFVEIVKAGRGEERFQTTSESENLRETAKKSLNFFTPWNTDCAIPEKFDPFGDVIKAFFFDKKDPDEEHRTEVRRIHAVIHPVCFARLADALKLPAPEEKMEIPKFMINTNHSPFDDNPTQPPGLGEDELRQIREILAAHAESRKALNHGFLRVVVDGAERAQIDPGKNLPAKLNLDESAELVEIFGDGETLLATHLFSFGELEKGARRQSVRLEGGREISFDFAPVFDEYGEVSEINLAVGYSENSWQNRFASALTNAKSNLAGAFSLPFLKPVLAFGLIILALTFGWFFVRNYNEKQEEFVKLPMPVIEKDEFKIPEPTPAKKEFAEDKPQIPTKSNQSLPKQNEKTAANQKPNRENRPQISPEKEIRVENPPKESLAIDRTIRQNENGDLDKDRILRLPIRETNDFPQRNVTRRGNLQKNQGKSFGEIKQIYIETSGDQNLGAQIGAQIGEQLANHGRFSITNEKEQADAALKIYIRYESDVDDPREKMVTAIVRLVNAEGFVVYPNQRRISGWKYVGEIAKLPARIAQDLTAVR